MSADARSIWLATLDPGIASYVDVLDAAGIETFESCQGDESHSFPERLSGSMVDGARASVPSPSPFRSVRYPSRRCGALGVSTATASRRGRTGK